MTRAEEEFHPVTFSHEVFQGLGELEETMERLKQRRVKREILGEMRSIFLKYDVASSIGVMLLHRHFDITPGEIVVEYGNIATPWDIPEELLEENNGVEPQKVISIFGGTLVARCWKLKNGQLFPTEYGFNPPRLGDKEATVVGEYAHTRFKRGFIEDLGKFLKDNDLEDVFGLTVLDRVRSNSDIGQFRGIERTIGRVSVTITVDAQDPTLLSNDGKSTAEKNDALEAVLSTGGIEAVWTFGCHEDMSNSTVLPNLARICWVCQGCKKKSV